MARRHVTSYLRPVNYDYIFIGDSFTEGVGLNYNDTFVGIFEKNLSNKDIGNLAMSDYSPRNYYHKIKEYILKLDIHQCQYSYLY